MKQKNSKPTGYILHQGKNVVIIATLESENVKTGNMIQIWILNRHESPVESVKSGSDKNVCFDCPMRGDGFDGRACYVNVGQGPTAVWRAYQAGSYPVLRRRDYASVFHGRAVRFGAYGEPVLIPLAIVRAIVAACDKWTGYTHQWRKAKYAEYRAFVMASCDSQADYQVAKLASWRTFRVRTADSPVLSREIICPASDEAGKRTTCVRCGLCNGTQGPVDARKDIVIIVHGSQAKNFVSLDSIA